MARQRRHAPDGRGRRDDEVRSRFAKATPDNDPSSPRLRRAGDPADANESVCETKYWAWRGKWGLSRCLGLSPLSPPIVGSDGTLAERYEYTPYGQRTVYKSAGANDPMAMAPILESRRVQVSGIDQPYGLCVIGHQGLLHDKESGLIYNRARYLHPVLGRFMQRDPVGFKDGMNVYQYCRNNTVGMLDPTGQLAIDKTRWLRRRGKPMEVEHVLSTPWNCRLTAIVGTPLQQTKLPQPATIDLDYYYEMIEGANTDDQSMPNTWQYYVGNVGEPFRNFGEGVWAGELTFELSAAQAREKGPWKKGQGNLWKCKPIAVGKSMFMFAAELRPSPGMFFDGTNTGPERLLDSREEKVEIDHYLASVAKGRRIIHEIWGRWRNDVFANVRFFMWEYQSYECINTQTEARVIVQAPPAGGSSRPSKTPPSPSYGEASRICP